MEAQQRWSSIAGSSCPENNAQLVPGIPLHGAPGARPSMGAIHGARMGASGRSADWGGGLAPACSRGLRCVGVVPALLLWGHELIDAARPPPPPMSCGGIAVRAPSSTATLARMPRLVVSSATFAGVARQAFRLPRDVAAYSRHGLQWASSRVHMVELRTVRFRPSQVSALPRAPNRLVVASTLMFASAIR
ncbi:uncharacterized protein CC84DRAFT_1209923 [Paraphaeosphaeria sporulosa]|uniref:Uncharacterized protein n=1 Tax=Paraphaeosphaeria sporulosa TaxID=1460663 RepID=A0A177BW01_9PLEO|nr:uncharacterized protein CC84DRAFT_1209923 [Paraphaeosphaeria sporulosa]OAF99592.1 hypothetical protein CC84DRAFT_1209923 [Paraphaeosphaeria sporulosa]